MYLLNLLNYMQVYNLVFFIGKKKQLQRETFRTSVPKKLNWKAVLEDKSNSLDQKKGVAVWPKFIT